MREFTSWPHAQYLFRDASKLYISFRCHWTSVVTDTHGQHWQSAFCFFEKNISSGRDDISFLRQNPSKCREMLFSPVARHEVYVSIRIQGPNALSFSQHTQHVSIFEEQDPHSARRHRHGRQSGRFLGGKVRGLLLYEDEAYFEHFSPRRLI